MGLEGSMFQNPPQRESLILCRQVDSDDHQSRVEGPNPRFLLQILLRAQDPKTEFVEPQNGLGKVTRGCHAHLASRPAVDVGEATAMVV